jgi:hypothetical protein
VEDKDINQVKEVFLILFGKKEGKELLEMYSREKKVIISNNCF